LGIVVSHYFSGHSAYFTLRIFASNTGSLSEN
jgi:hypothetical protein